MLGFGGKFMLKVGYGGRVGTRFLLKYAVYLRKPSDVSNGLFKDDKHTLGDE